MKATQQLRVIQLVIIMSTERGSPRASYSARFKLHVVVYAVDHGNREAGKHFKVDEKVAFEDGDRKEKNSNLLQKTNVQIDIVYRHILNLRKI